MEPAENVCTQAHKKSVLMTLPPFLGNWKVNVKGRQPVNFFRHLFPRDLIDETGLMDGAYA